MIGDVTLKVTPEVLYEQATEVSTRVKNMQSYFDEITSIISGTAGYWIGDASDAYRKSYEEKKPELEEIFKRLGEYVTDLEQIAGVYEEVETANTETAEELPGDVII